MMAITSMADLVAASPGQEINFQKNSSTGSSGGLTTLWKTLGFPGAASDPGNTTTGIIPTKATAGSPDFVNPASGKTYVSRFQLCVQQLNSVTLYDRLWHGGTYSFVNGTISANTTTAVDRDSSGEGAELWIEIVGSTSALACNLTFTYVNQAGVGGRTATIAVTPSAAPNRIFVAALQAGDSGIQQITNIAGDAAPTGSFTAVIGRKICTIGNDAINTTTILSWEDLWPAVVPDDACLAVYVHQGAGTTGFISGSLNLVQG